MATETLTPTEARRIFLAAQSLARKRRGKRIGDKQFRDYLNRQGVLQLDSVNVLARAHYLPLFSRFGPYPTEKLDRYLWSSGEAFEHWGHEASVMPRRLLPLLRHRMEEQESRWARYVRNKLDKSPGFLTGIEGAIQDKGPLTAADLTELDPGAGQRRGSWWDWSDAKLALEFMFFTGRAAVAGRPNFQRLYGAPAKVWGADHQVPGVARQEARQALFDHALAAAGIGTAGDIGDHFRIKKSHAKPLADSAVARGLARRVKVQGWDEPALLAAAAEDPGRATGAALLSPFDPVCWYRDRMIRMFGMHYRIEIYTPAHKRIYGYYTLPFLLGDQLVARVDLKADRKSSELLVQSSWQEEQAAPGGRRRGADEIAAALASELRLVADWLGLGAVVVKPAGTLAPALALSVAVDRSADRA